MRLIKNSALPEDSLRKTYCIPETLCQALDLIAIEQGNPSRSALVRRAIAEFVQRETAKATKGKK